jgi:hypothetical protein
MTFCTVAGGENLQASGGVLVGDRILTVVLTQGVGKTAEELLAVGEQLLTLMLDAAS